MPQLNLVVSRKARYTGRVLNNVLREQGLDTRCLILGRNGNGVTPSDLGGVATVCYGSYIRDPRESHTNHLNGTSARLSKLAQADRVAMTLPRGSSLATHQASLAHHQAGSPMSLQASGVRYPLLGRSRFHMGGRDIVPILGPSDLADRLSLSQIEFLTEYVDTVKEYRVWVYRGRHLGSYEKYLSRPERYTGIGRNYDNGWAFRLVPSDAVDRQVVAIAGLAVDALGLDFGGVDVGVRPDGSPVVFEVNRAPGVEGGTRQVIRALGRKIANWVRSGCPKRSAAAQSFDGRDVESALEEAFAS